MGRTGSVDFVLPLGRDGSVRDLVGLTLHASYQTPTHMSSEHALPVPRRFRLVLELTLFDPPSRPVSLPCFFPFPSPFSAARSPHCSNAVYFRWLETGRLNFMRVLGSHLQNEQAAKDLSGSGKGKGVILARITFDYRVSLSESFFFCAARGRKPPILTLARVCTRVHVRSDQSCSRTMS